MSFLRLLFARNPYFKMSVKTCFKEATPRHSVMPAVDCLKAGAAAPETRGATP